MYDFSISLSNLSYEIVNFCQAKSFSLFMLFTLLKMISYDVEIYLSHAMLKAPFFGFWDIHVVVVKVMVAIAVFLIEFVPIVARPHRSRPDKGRRDRGHSDRTQSSGIICWFIYNCSDSLNTRVRENESDWHDGVERTLQF